MTKTIQEKVVEEVIAELKQDPDIVGIEIFGSIARKEIKPTSDVNLQVTSKSATKTKLVCGKKKGIYYHYFVMPYVAVKRMSEMYLFLFCPEPSLIVYDPTGILSELYQSANNYYEAHPDALKFWKERKWLSVINAKVNALRMKHAQPATVAEKAWQMEQSADHAKAVALCQNSAANVMELERWRRSYEQEQCG